MPSLLDLLTGTRGGWNPDVAQAGVRPGYGLEGAGVGPLAQSEHERTLRPGETRSASDLQAMLAEVILAAGSGALPAAGGKGPARQAPARVRTGFTPEFLQAQRETQAAAMAALPPAVRGFAEWRKGSPVSNPNHADFGKAVDLESALATIDGIRSGTWKHQTMPEAAKIATRAYNAMHKALPKEERQAVLGPVREYMEAAE